MRIGVACLVMVFAACGDNGGPVTGDAGTTPDVTPDTYKGPAPEAGVDAPSDAGPTDAPGFDWPDCLSQPPNVPTKSIVDLWNDDPTQPVQVWVPGVYVTAVSAGACKTGSACEFFLQQDETYASLGLGAHHAIREWVTTSTSKYFTSLAVGDQVNVMGWAYRDTSNAKNELILHVDLIEPGCAVKVGTGAPTPVLVQLSDLDQVTDYEQVDGPLLVQVDLVTGTPQQPAQTFGLGNTFFDGGGNSGQIVSLSPYFLTGAVFTGLTTGQKTKFASVTGVYDLFSPTPIGDAAVSKYLEICPRTMADVVP